MKTRHHLKHKNKVKITIEIAIRLTRYRFCCEDRTCDVFALKDDVVLCRHVVEATIGPDQDLCAAKERLLGHTSRITRGVAIGHPIQID
jgi:hypothetical protein